jgi:hypothetical protein
MTGRVQLRHAALQVTRHPVLGSLCVASMTVIAQITEGGVEPDEDLPLRPALLADVHHHRAARRRACSCCSALANSRDAAPLPGSRSPGIVATARSVASTIRSRRSISSPRYRTSDASLAVLRGRIRAQNAARLRRSVRRLLIASAWPPGGCPGTSARAGARPAGRPGGIFGVVHWQSPLDSSHLYQFVLLSCGCYGHCMRCRTRRAGGRLTADGTVSDQAVTQRASGCQGTVTVLMVMQVSCQFLPGIRADLPGAGALPRAMAASAIASSLSMTAVRRSARCRLQEPCTRP